MKIALTGSTGYISSFVIKRFKDRYEILKIDKSDQADRYLDLEDGGVFDYDVLNDVDLVVFPAAISSPDLCEKEYDMCYRINVEGTGTFIKEAIRRGCKVLFFSSDAVFGDHPDRIFDENSETNASTAYGRMKKAIEDRFKDEKAFKAIRLSYVVSKKDKFTSYALKCRENDTVCEVYDPFFRNCITISDVLDSIEWLIENWDSFGSRFLNIAGRELIGREDIVKTINELSDRKIRYKVVYPGDAFYTCRPVSTSMKSLYLFEYGILKDESFFEKMRKEFCCTDGCI